MSMTGYLSFEEDVTMHNYNGTCCTASLEPIGYYCTRPPGHAAPHLAGTGKKTLAAWWEDEYAFMEDRLVYTSYDNA